MKPTAGVTFCLAVLVAAETALATLRRGSDEKYDNPSWDNHRSTLLRQRRRDKKTDDRIVGGGPAWVGEFPYFVQWVGCGATLIAADILLSAAHCAGVKSNGVLVGAFKSYDTVGGAQFRTITARVVHPKFSYSSQMYDFMVMQLDSPVTNILPVILNQNSSQPKTNDVLTVIGFGLTSDGCPPAYLNQATVKAMSASKCSKDYSGSINSTFLFCAGGNGKDTCQGDSGGPVLTTSGVQVGVTSAGIGCGQSKYPGIYGRIDRVIDWINQQVCALSANPPLRCININYSEVPTVAPAPVPAPSSGLRTVRIDVMYDLKPTETTWIMWNSAGAKVANCGTGKANSIVRTYIQIAPGNYVLQFSDKGRDGFCCGFGIGYYSIYIIYNGVYMPVLQGSGQFKRQMNATFTIPYLPPTLSPSFFGNREFTFPPTPTRLQPSHSPDTTSSPTQAPISTYMPTPISVSLPTLRPVSVAPTPPVRNGTRCVDSANQYFSFNGNLSGTYLTNATQRCVWLSSRKPWIKELCQPGQSAYNVCPKTCGKCSDPCQDQDDLNATFLVYNVSRHCNYLRIRPHLWGKYCAKNKTAYKFCKETCNSC